MKKRLGAELRIKKIRTHQYEVRLGQYHSWSGSNHYFSYLFICFYNFGYHPPNLFLFFIYVNLFKHICKFVLTWFLCDSYINSRDFYVIEPWTILI